MGSRVLLIKGKGGLGNRILSAVCGLVFADLTGRRAVIDWRDGSYAPLGINAYPLLFDTPIARDCAVFDRANAPVSPPLWTGHLGLTPQAMIEKFMPKAHSNPMGYRKLCTDLSRLDATEDIAVFWSYLPKFGRISRHLRLDPRFADKSQKTIITNYLNRYFTPNDRVRDQVSAISSKLEQPTIGVHIRYTDRKIPLEAVKKRLRQKRQQMPDAAIFLATDNADVQSQMASEFSNLTHIAKHLRPDGGRLHWPEADIAKLEEAENALIDMYLLARCDHLIYSRHSTFSETSALIGQMTADQLSDVDRLSPTVVAKRWLQAYA